MFTYATTNACVICVTHAIALTWTKRPIVRYQGQEKCMERRRMREREREREVERKGRERAREGGEREREREKKKGGREERE